MNAPWVMDMRHMARLDEEEARSYGDERLAMHIASDHRLLACAIADLDEESPVMQSLAAALCAVWRNGRKTTPEQAWAITSAVQRSAEDKARRICAVVND